jgi:hypothetical protein
MTSSSRPTMQAKIPAAMKKLFHMMSRADRGSLRQRVRGHLIETSTGSIGRARPVAQTTWSMRQAMLAVPIVPPRHLDEGGYSTPSPTARASTRSGA